MATYFINNISNSLREFDEYAQSLEHYKGFAWTGLSTYGVRANYITNQEFGDFLVLSHVVQTDTHANNCDN